MSAKLSSQNFGNHFLILLFLFVISCQKAQEINPSTPLPNPSIKCDTCPEILPPPLPECPPPPPPLPECPPPPPPVLPECPPPPPPEEPCIPCMSQQPPPQPPPEPPCFACISQQPPPPPPPQEPPCLTCVVQQPPPQPPPCFNCISNCPPSSKLNNGCGIYSIESYYSNAVKINYDMGGFVAFVIVTLLLEVIILE